MTEYIANLLKNRFVRVYTDTATDMKAEGPEARKQAQKSTHGNSWPLCMAGFNFCKSFWY